MNNDKVRDFFDMKSAHWDERKTRPIEVYDEMARNLFKLKEGERVLDLGCGSGTFIPSIYKLTKTKVIGMDISPKMIELAKPKFKDNKDIELIAQDFYDSDLKDIDVIVSHNTYSHFIYPEEFEEKVAKLLKPGGRLIISHFVGISDLNLRHGKMCQQIGRVLKTSEEEAKVFLKDFDVVTLSDEPRYIMSFIRK